MTFVNAIAIRLSVILLAVGSLTFVGEARAQLGVAPTVNWNQDGAVKAEARTVGQRYCAGDADLFTVALNFRIRVTNNSKSPIYLRSDMAQAFVRVASDLEAARRGTYMYESGGGSTLFSADQKPPPVREIPILAGHSADLSIQGGVVARYKADFSFPTTVPPGRYALQLLLRPETDFPPLDHGTLKSITVNPVAFEITEDPHPTACH